MFSKQTKPRSIASQLVLLFTLAAALLLTCGLGVFYLIVVRHSFEEDNQFLADRLSALRGELTRGDGLASLTATLRGARAGKVEAYWMRVINSNGDIVVETPKMSEFLPPPIFPDVRDKNLADHPKNYRTNKKLFSLLTTTEQMDGQWYVVQIAQDRTSDETFATQSAWVLGAALAVGIVISASIAIAVTKRGLFPLQQLAKMLEGIDPSHLDERVGTATWPRELQPVAAAFDDMLARLENSFTRLSQFSADIAHELRTPITNIRGEAEVSLTRPRELEEYRNVIESIAAECERLSNIVDNLLFLARAEGVDRQIERKVFAAQPAIEKIAAYYRTVAEERGVCILNQANGEVFADGLLFDRALSNLLDNALRFTTSGEKITIATRTIGDRTELIVEDTGIGIPPQHLPHIYDRFYRVDSSRTSHGTGLGLALVKSIAELHGGSVSMASEVNRGTTVTVCLPTKTAPVRKLHPLDHRGTAAAVARRPEG